MPESTSAELSIEVLAPVVEVRMLQNPAMKEDRLMPSRILGLIVDATVPSFGRPWMTSAVAIVVGIGTFFVPANAMLKWLAAAIVADLISGILAKRSGFPRPHISFVGAGVYGFCYAIAQYLSKQPELQWEVWNRTWGIGEFLALWFITGHLANLTKNFDDLDTPFPKGVNNAISVVRKLIDSAEIGGPIVSIFKSSMSQKGGNTEITSKTETTVTTIPPPEKP